MIEYIKYSLFHHIKYLSRSGNTLLQYILLQFLLMSFFMIPTNGELYLSGSVQVAIHLITYVTVYVLCMEKYYSVLISYQDVYLYYSTGKKEYKSLNLLLIIIAHFVSYGLPLSMTTSIIVSVTTAGGQFLLELLVHKFLLIVINSWFLTLLGFIAYTISFKLKLKTVVLNVIIFPLYMPTYLMSHKLLSTESPLLIESFIYIIGIVIALSYVSFYLSMKTLNYVFE